MSFTYDISTPIGQVRFNIGDKNPEEPDFQDEEIQYLLNEYGNNIIKSSAYALQALANDSAKIATKMEIEGYKRDATQITRELKARAAELFSKIIDMPITDSGPSRMERFVYDPTSLW